MNISHNFTFVSHNCDFIAHNCQYVAHNCDFISRSCKFVCHNLRPKTATSYISQLWLSHSCNIISDMWLFIRVATLHVTIWFNVLFLFDSYQLHFFSNVKTFFIHQYSEHPEDYANRSSALNSELKYKDTLVKLYVWPTWTMWNLCGKIFRPQGKFQIAQIPIELTIFDLGNSPNNSKCDRTFTSPKSNSCVLWATIFLIFSMSTLAIKF